MINKDILSTIFNPNNIDYEIDYITIYKEKSNIHILDEIFYKKSLNHLKINCIQRKNCWIMRSNNIDNVINIFFQESFIKSIIRQKTLKTILND